MGPPGLKQEVHSGHGTMSAAVMEAVGPPSVLHFKTDVPMPFRRPGEVLVKVAAASVNPVDFKIRGGKGGIPTAAISTPRILGGDVAGVVVEADAFSKFKPGDKVFGCTEHAVPWSKFGTYAEYVSTHESTLQPIPSQLSFQEAAAVPLAAMTAWQAMEPSMPLQGKRVLVHAGAGGVGHFAIQIAKAQGAFVASTCGTHNVEFVKGLGADRPIDYKKERFEDVFPGTPYDLVVDTMGGDYELRSIKLVKPGSQGGHFAHILNSGFVTQRGVLLGSALMSYYLAKHTLSALLGWGPSYKLVVLDYRAHMGLDQLSKLISEGKLRPTIDTVFPLSEAAAAHTKAEEGHVRGKLVLHVADIVSA